MLDQQDTRACAASAGKLERWGRAIRAYRLARRLSWKCWTSTMHAQRDGQHARYAELRADCIDIGRMFEQLGYRSHRLQQRQDTLMAVLDHCCVALAPCWRFWPA
jgi:hypothetical protein